MWLLLLGLTASLIHSVQMLKCMTSSGNEETCPANHYCSITRINTEFLSDSGDSGILRSCMPTAYCQYVIGSITSFNVGYYNMTISCCKTDGCNKGNLPEHYAPPNGLKCDSCNGIDDNKCNTSMSCVGVQNCCLKDFSSVNGIASMNNGYWNGCATKNLCGDITAGNLGNKSTVHFSLLLMSLICVVFLK